MTKTKAKVESQIDKFKEAARELECNESEKDFDTKLKKLTGKRIKPAKPKQKGGQGYIA